jgi:hypothetical protein
MRSSITNTTSGRQIEERRAPNPECADPTALIWLPPAEMTDEIHEFDARVGGGYQMSLFHPPDERSLRGKTSDREDRTRADRSSAGELGDAMSMSQTRARASIGRERRLRLHRLQTTFHR